MVDRTTKILLALIVVALSTIYVHLVLSQSNPAEQTDTAPTPRGNAGVVVNGTYTYVVSDGYLSIWNTQNVNGHDQLVMVDTKPLPSAAQ